MKSKILKYFVLVIFGCIGCMSHTLAIPAPEVLPIALSQATLKSETVYASLDSDGRVEQMSVVNVFTDKVSDIVDYGKYENIVNLTNDIFPAIEGDRIKFGLTPEYKRQSPFFYEGMLKEARLPWTIRIAYLLDGESVSAEELAGKTGDLTLSIHLRQNGEAMAWFQERYMLQIRVPFFLDKASSINAPEASQMIVGSSNHLSFIFLPQESQSFVIRAAIRDFEMEAIEVVALQFNPESISYKGNGIANMEQLMEGLKEMTEASRGIHEGLTASESAIQEFDQELSSIGIHAVLLAKGLGEFESSMLLLLENVPQFRSGSKQVYEGLGELHQGSQMLYGGYGEIAEGIGKTLEQKEKLREIAAKYLMSPSEDIKTMAFAIAGMLNGLEKLDDGIQELNGHFESFSGGLQEIATEYGAMDEGIAELADHVPRITLEVKPLFDGVNGLLNGLPELSRGFSEFYQGYRALPEGLGELYEGQKMALDELSEVETWMKRVAGSAGSRKVLSFVDPEKNRVESVQFILRTKGIVKTVEIDANQEKETPRNFWQKLLDLFSW